MSEFAIELRDLTKVFPPGRGEARGLTAVKDLSLKIRGGEFFTFLGPSGCGKTTTLRMIAGFEKPTSGQILLQGHSMAEIPPNRRPVNTVFQNYALFPHLNVMDNVGFGLVVKRVPREERVERVEQALDLVQLGGMGDRRPSQLSGGQQQRVALARALVNRPAVLLLDEPLGALDLKLRKAMQIELKHLQGQVGITFIYVTHDQEEALTMSDRIAVMSAGRVLQVDEPFLIYERPNSRFVADFVGESNFLQGFVERVNGTTAELKVGTARVPATLAGEAPPEGAQVTLVVRPEKLTLTRPNGEASALTARVEEIVYIGTDTRYVLRLPSQETLTARVQNADGSGSLRPAPGDLVAVSWPAEHARLLASA